VLDESEHISSKNRGPSLAIREIQNGDFLENASNNYDEISVIYGDHLPK
jgi:hypothetical protein